MTDSPVILNSEMEPTYKPNPMWKFVVVGGVVAGLGCSLLLRYKPIVNGRGKKCRWKSLTPDRSKRCIGIETKRV